MGFGASARPTWTSPLENSQTVTAVLITDSNNNVFESGSGTDEPYTDAGELVWVATDRRSSIIVAEMIVDLLEGRIKPGTSRLGCRRGRGDLALKLGGVLVIAQEENAILEGWSRECWRNRMEVHEINIIRFECVTEAGSEPEKYLIVARISRSEVFEFDCEIDIASRMRRLSGVRDEENREPDQMLSERCQEGFEIDRGVESGRLSGSHYV